MVNAQIMETEIIDQCIYRPLEEKLQNHDVTFERVYEETLNRRGVHVILHENGRSLYIAERLSYPESPKYHFFQYSYIYKGIEEPGWLIDEQYVADFFLLGGMVPASATLQVLLVSKAKLIQALADAGYDRQALNLRNELLRTAKRPGWYNMGRPDMALYMQNTERAAISIAIQTPFLEKIATANLRVVFNSETSDETLSGTWLATPISADFKRDIGPPIRG